MKKLILIQNDHPSTGKSTLVHCLSRYLYQYGVPHQVKVLAEDLAEGKPDHFLDSSRLTARSFLHVLDNCPITILEISTGLAEFFLKFYQNYQLESLFDGAGISLSVVLPITSESDSFDAVIEAAEVYSDNAEYLIAHLITSSYEDDEKIWDRSYAARVMDMFEAVELHIPEIGFQIEMELRAQHKELAEAILDLNAAGSYGKDFTKWNNRVMGQVESARQFLFGEAFKPLTQPKVTEKKGRNKALIA